MLTGGVLKIAHQMEVRPILARSKRRQHVRQARLPLLNGRRGINRGPLMRAQREPIHTRTIGTGLIHDDTQDQHQSRSAAVQAAGTRSQISQSPAYGLAKAEITINTTTPQLARSPP